MLRHVNNFSSSLNINSFSFFVNHSNIDSFYFYHRVIKQCGTGLLVSAILSGGSLSLLMFTASDIIQRNKTKLLSFSKSLGDTKDTSLYFKLEEEQEQENNRGSSSSKKSRSSSSSASTTTSKMLQFQYNQFLASLKKSWIFRVIDKHAKDGNQFGSNVFDELLSAYYGSFYSTNTKSEAEAAVETQNPFTRSRLVVSSVSRYFFVRFMHRVLWGLLVIGAEKGLSKLMFCPRTGRSLLSTEFTYGLCDEGISSFVQVNNGEIPSSTSVASVTINSLLELSLHLDFYYFGLSWSKFPSFIRNFSKYLLTTWSPAGAPCLSLNACSSLEEETSNTTFVIFIAKQTATFRDVIVFRLMNQIMSEHLFTIARNIVDIVRESFFSKVVDNRLTFELQQIHDDNNTTTNNTENNQKSLFDEKGKAVASINPNQQTRSAKTTAAIRKTTVLTRRERVSYFFTRMGRLARDVGKNLIPRMVRRSTGAIISTYIFTRLIGEERISWYTSSAICFAFWY